MKRIACFYVLLLSAGSAFPATQAATVIDVHNGVQQIKLDGHTMLTVRAHRENFNAHGFDVVSFYAVDKAQGKDALQLVPLFGDSQGKDKERYETTVSGGADCLLRDFRLVQGSGRQPARLIVAERELGESFATPGLVHFTYYELTRNADQVPGWPLLYFKMRSQGTSKQSYCDVNEAFDRELHLGA